MAKIRTSINVDADGLYQILVLENGKMVYVAEEHCVNGNGTAYNVGDLTDDHTERRATLDDLMGIPARIKKEFPCLDPEDPEFFETYPGSELQRPI
jgi:hypothetical protein